MRTTLFTPWQNWVAQPTRNIKTSSQTLFLTFDDGPNIKCLGPILETLEKHNAKATFFMVAEKAKAHPDLVHQVLNAGHSIGDHSLDHTYGAFFKSRKRLKDWILDSQKILSDLIGQPPIGFRPPNGVCTPPLASVLRELDIPLFLWNERFFDTVLPWTPSRATQSLKTVKSGDIVLLHDSMQDSLFETFLPTLNFYLQRGREDEFLFSPISFRKFD